MIVETGIRLKCILMSSAAWASFCCRLAEVSLVAGLLKFGLVLVLYFIFKLCYLTIYISQDSTTFAEITVHRSAHPDCMR